MDLDAFSAVPGVPGLRPYMPRSALVCFLLLNCAALAPAADFRLGLDHTQWGPAIAANEQIAADNAGALYILDISASSLTKLAADGTTILWQQNLASPVSAMAVDPNGGVYLIADATVPSAVVEKLSANSATVMWKTAIEGSVSLAVDDSGRAFVATNNGLVIRLNASGAIDATFPIAARPISLAVSPSGSDIAVGTYVAHNPYDSLFVQTYAFLRLGPDQTNWITVRPPLAPVNPGLSVAANGDAIVYGSDAPGHWSLQRFDRTGNVVFSKSVPSNGQAPGNLALDAAGNAYITGYTGVFGIPTKDTLAPCGSTWMSVYAPGGTVLQTTFLPGATSTTQAYPFIAVGQGGAVFVLSQADTTFTPTQNGAFPQSATALFNLSQNADAKILPLGCVANAYSFNTGPVAGGEMVALYGNDLGPAQGVQTTATAGVQVTFDGVPAPLQWVQDSQVNAAVPFSVADPATQICVTYNSANSNCLTWPVAAAAPGVLTWDGTNAVAVNQDGTLNSASNPAPQDSIVAIFATGLGPINAPLPDGSLVPVSPLPVNAYPVTIGVPFHIGFVPAMSYLPADYAGPAPLQIAGTSQINFHASYMPATGTDSLYVEVKTSTGTIQSNGFRIYVAGTASH